MPFLRFSCDSKPPFEKAKPLYNPLAGCSILSFRRGKCGIMLHLLNVALVWREHIDTGRN